MNVAASNFASRDICFEWCLVVAELTAIVLEPIEKPSKNQHELSVTNESHYSTDEGNDELGSLGGFHAS